MEIVNESGEVLYLPKDSEYVHVTERKLSEFRNLEAGWRYGEGVPFKVATLKDAMSLHETAVSKGFMETDVFPGANGEIMLTVYHEDHYLEFTVEKNGSVTIVRERGDEEICCLEGKELADAHQMIGDLRAELCKSSGLSTEESLTEGKKSSKAWRLRIVAAAESPLLIENASSNEEAASAHTFEYSMPESPANRQYSGSSLQLSYQSPIG